MRAILTIDSVSPLSVHLLTLAYQRTLRHTPDVMRYHGNHEPSVKVAGSAMTWTSPAITSDHVQSLLDEYDRLITEDSARLQTYHGHLADVERVQILTAPTSTPASVQESADA